MTTRQLHQAVSHVTGEDLDLIAHRGFSLVDDDLPPAEEDWAQTALDWNQHEAERRDEQPSPRNAVCL